MLSAEVSFRSDTCREEPSVGAEHDVKGQLFSQRRRAWAGLSIAVQQGHGVLLPRRVTLFSTPAFCLQLCRP